MKQSATQQKHIFIATLSTEPQGITRVLDWLLAEEYPIEEAIVVHTTGAVIEPSLKTVTSEFEAGVYPGVFLQTVPIIGPDGLIGDIRSAADAGALLQTLYRVLRQARQSGRPIHFSITSGRKTMAVYGMVAAQLLFAEQDRLWHMIATNESGGIDKRLHAAPDEVMEMVEVPVLHWANAGTAAALLTADNPWEALQQQQHIAYGEQARQVQTFLNYYLTKREKELVELLVKTGMDNAGLARELGKREQTVANQLTAVYRKFDEWQGWQTAQPKTGTRSVLVAALRPYIVENY